jgi:putative transposase
MGASKRRRGVDGWRALLGRFAGSGLTVQAFCQREAISAVSFYRWRSQLSGASTELAAVACPSPTAAAGFVDLGPLGAPSVARSRVELRLDLGEGLVLHLVRG